MKFDGVGGCGDRMHVDEVQMVGLRGGPDRED